MQCLWANDDRGRYVLTRGVSVESVVWGQLTRNPSVGHVVIYSALVANSYSGNSLRAYPRSHTFDFVQFWL